MKETVFTVFEEFGKLIGVSLTQDGAEWEAIKWAMDDYAKSIDDADHLANLSFGIVQDGHPNRYRIAVSYVAFASIDTWCVVHIDETKLMRV